MGGASGGRGNTAQTKKACMALPVVVYKTCHKYWLTRREDESGHSEAELGKPGLKLLTRAREELQLCDAIKSTHGDDWR